MDSYFQLVFIIILLKNVCLFVFILFHILKSLTTFCIIFAFFFSSFRITADSESTTEPGAIQDILTCGSCQKTFALGDIVKFIQHKVLQCNKENYGQCFPQGKINVFYCYLKELTIFLVLRIIRGEKKKRKINTRIHTKA